MSTVTNKRIYETLEFDTWSNAEHLFDDEKYLVKTFLDKNKKTVEAGTAAGRILLDMQNIGFASLYGFDFLPEYIAQAKQRDQSQNIVFEVQDATDLNYEDCSFEQILYLQQIISSIEDETARKKAFKEAYRILKKEGTALFSFLSFEVRSRSAIYRPYLMYLQIARKLRGLNLSIQYLPWLRHGDKFNFSSLLDAAPYTYWYKLSEAHQILTEVGFQVMAVGSSYQINQGKMHNSLETLVNEPLQGMIYFVCTK